MMAVEQRLYDGILEAQGQLCLQKRRQRDGKILALERGIRR